MAEERVQPIALHQEMQRSYLEYAMSVIAGIGQGPMPAMASSRCSAASSTRCTNWA